MMKNVKKELFLILLPLVFMFGACGTVELSKQFSIEEYRMCSPSDYLSNEKLLYAKTEEGALFPRITAYNHEEYAVYMEYYTSDSGKSVEICSVEIYDENDKVWSIEEKFTVYTNNGVNIPNGEVFIGCISNEIVDALMHDNIYVKVKIKDKTDGDTREKQLEYVMAVNTYKMSSSYQ